MLSARSEIFLEGRSVGSMSLGSGGNSHALIGIPAESVVRS